MCKHRLIFFNCGHYFHELMEQCRLHHDALREAGWPGWVGSINMPIIDSMETDDVAVGYRRHPCGHCQMQFRPGWGYPPYPGWYGYPYPTWPPGRRA